MGETAMGSPTPPATPPAGVPATPPAPPAAPPAALPGPVGPPPAEPGSGESGFPANTPLEQMTAPQREAYWKHHARRHEDRVKAMGDYAEVKAKAEQFDALAAASQSEQERAVAAAKAEGLAEGRRAAAATLVEAAVTVAAAGRLTDAQRAALLAGLDRSAFLTTAGEVDTAKVTEFVNGLAPAQGAAGQPPVPDMGQGRRGHATASGRDAGLAEAQRRYGAPRAPAGA
jgi:hypothetical protein